MRFVPETVILPLLLALNVRGCVPVKVFAFEKVHSPAPGEVKVFMLAFIGTAELTVNAFPPAWEMAVMLLPMAPERVATGAPLAPMFVIVPV